MPGTPEVESTLTAGYQTIVPEIVRHAYRLGKRNRILVTIRPGGEAVPTRVEPPRPTTGGSVISRAAWAATWPATPNPCRLQAREAGNVQRPRSLTGSIEVDLDAALLADDE